MKNILFYAFLLLNSCYKLPQREEIEYRNKLENTIVKTFPKKINVVIHSFENMTPSDTNRAYLSEAISDSIEAMLEPLRSTLAYIPFDGMPFYISKELSNLIEQITINNDTNRNTNTNSSSNDMFSEENIKTNANTNGQYIDNRYQKNYFSYLTNYLILIPTQVTQEVYNLTTNTNYYEIFTNNYFENGISMTNFSSNEILVTTTNSIKTNVVIVNKMLLTPTNMLMLIYEEFPELTNYLSFLPIEVRKASEIDISNFIDLQEKITNPIKWKAKKEQQEKEAVTTEATDIPEEEKSDTKKNKSMDPEFDFEYTYHITGNFRTIKANSMIEPVLTDINLTIHPPQSSGNDWWEEYFNIEPPELTKIIELDKKLGKNKNTHKEFYLRTPFTKPDISTRLRDEFNDISTNFRDFRPEIPTKKMKLITSPVNLEMRVAEDQIPLKLMTWLKDFHATIINRPYTALNVTSTPEDTLIYLNGFYIGKTPLTYPTAPIGQQRVTFLKEGYSKEEILVEISPNSTNTINYTLHTLDNSGSITITSSKPAEVYLNTQYKGKTPVTLSNLNLHFEYRVEILDPKANLISNRNSVYKSFTLTEKKPHINFDARFKTFETSYKKPAQKALLATTYLSWFTTIGILAGGIYSQSRAKEYEALGSLPGLDQSNPSQQQFYQKEALRYSTIAQVTLYSAIAGAVFSCGIMGWYLYSKDVYVGLDIEHRSQQEWYANFKLKFK